MLGSSCLEFYSIAIYLANQRYPCCLTGCLYKAPALYECRRLFT